MRAKVIIEDLKLEDYLYTLPQKLAAITGLFNIRVNMKECSVSFNYRTEEAALQVLEKLKS